MELQLINSTKKIKLPEGIFDCEFNEPLVHQLVTAYMSGGRSGNHCQKTRAEVSGGGIKPWRQKGTGRARAGTSRGPIWRKGGLAFAAKPRSYKQKLNKKAYRVAMCSILSELYRQNRFLVVEELKIAAPKTKEVIKTLADFFKDMPAREDNKLDRVLIITDEADQNLVLGSRNIPYMQIRDAMNIDPVSLVNADKVVITKKALKSIEEWLE